MLNASTLAALHQICTNVHLSVELTQVQLAKALGISDKMVSQIENGFRQPSAEILRNMAEQLGCSADEILGVQQQEKATDRK